VIQEGKLIFSQAVDCEDLSTCFGNNPSTFYGLYLLPISPVNVSSGAVSNNLEDATYKPWRMRRDEAVIFLGKTPPEARYFSFRSYLYDRQGNSENRSILYASLGDSLNQNVITTLTDNPFNANTMVITTGDRITNARIRNAAVAVGIPHKMINTDILAADILRLGLEQKSDRISMLYRISLFTDTTEGQSYMDVPPQ